jgi:hypothetical protein
MIEMEKVEEDINKLEDDVKKIVPPNLQVYFRFCIKDTMRC